jgi:hypothetical protein
VNPNAQTVARVRTVDSRSSVGRYRLKKQPLAQEEEALLPALPQNYPGSSHFLAKPFISPDFSVKSIRFAEIK